MLFSPRAEWIGYNLQYGFLDVDTDLPARTPEASKLLRIAVSPDTLRVSLGEVTVE
jgi:hypothetical protein